MTYKWQDTSDQQTVNKMSLTTRFQALLDHPAGPKTVFFWAPMMKWALVIAGLSDLKRPPEKLSVSQSVGTFLILFSILKLVFPIRIKKLDLIRD